jgi:uncharacterized OB-fold protein
MKNPSQHMAGGTLSMALTTRALEEIAKNTQIELNLLKNALRKELSGEAEGKDILRVPYRIGVTLNRSMCHASQFFRELRDHGVFYAGLCPVCKYVLFPPIRPVCPRCIRKGKLLEFEPFLLGNEIHGTVISWSKLVRGTSKHLGHGEVYPSIVRVDGADNAHWQYVLPNQREEIRVGARVKSVLRNIEERTGEISDYVFQLV